MSNNSLTRRGFVHGAGAGLVAAPAILNGLTLEANAHSSDLFTLGVMSGDPAARHVTLWTRLAPDPLNGGGMPRRSIGVYWEVATDPDMRHVVRRGRTIARPNNGHAVKVTVGRLPANSWLYYRFRAWGEWSGVGRTRTFPAPYYWGYHQNLRPKGRDDQMRFALTSCQNYEQGFFAAWRDIAENKDNIDFILHVGDYIYENGATSTPFDPARIHSGAEIFSVEDYRNRYAQYRLDPHLQQAQALFPLIHTPDDHEVDNDYAGLVAEEGAPFQGRDFVKRRKNAFKVLAESMPYGRGVRRERNGNINLYRQIDFGNLASFFVLDTRQYRSDQPAEAGFGSADPDSALLEQVLGEVIYDPEIDSPKATLLGGRQERWLKRSLRRSSAHWNVLAQQIMMTEWNLRETGRASILFNPTIPDEVKAQVGPIFDQVDKLLNVDAWDGYRAARTRLFDFLDRKRPSNPVILTGDIHSAWAANLLKDFSDSNSDMLAAEFVCTSISSTFATIDPRPTDAVVKAGLGPVNPQVEFFNGLFRGYCLCEVNREKWTTTFRSVGTLADAANTADPLALVPRASSPVVNDAVVEVETGFNKKGSAKRLNTTFSQL